MFTQTIRELEKDGLVLRKIFPVVPPKMEYTLSARGKSLETYFKKLRHLGFGRY
jgi:DNA-binding HxlR family transcriptional regulator